MSPFTLRYAGLIVNGKTLLLFVGQRLISRPSKFDSIVSRVRFLGNCEPHSKQLAFRQILAETRTRIRAGNKRKLPIFRFPLAILS